VDWCFKIETIKLSNLFDVSSIVDIVLVDYIIPVTGDLSNSIVEHGGYTVT
jgi:hypothetical protein